MVRHSTFCPAAWAQALAQSATLCLQRLHTQACSAAPLCCAVHHCASQLAVQPQASHAPDALQVHAEANAILNRNAASLRGCTAYVALFPCNECCKLIIQSGIKEVVYVSDKYHDTTPMKASRRMLELAGVVYRQYLPPEGTITIDFSAAL